jgi:hypothetical protein
MYFRAASFQSSALKITMFFPFRNPRPSTMRTGSTVYHLMEETNSCQSGLVNAAFVAPGVAATTPESGGISFLPQRRANADHPSGFAIRTPHTSTAKAVDESRRGRGFGR